jgi:hypothetical protein
MYTGAKNAVTGRKYISEYFNIAHRPALVIGDTRKVEYNGMGIRPSRAHPHDLDGIPDQRSGSQGRI